MPQKPIIPRTCETCGKYFNARPQNVKAGGGRFCSNKCSANRVDRYKGSRPNVVRFEGDVAYLSIVNLNNEVIAEVLVDRTDYDRVSEYRWSLSTLGYVVCTRSRNGTNKQVSLHRLIMGLDTGDRTVVDHINRDRLDNRRVNLRRTTAAGNSKNRAEPTSSQFTNVTWDKLTGRWVARVGRRGQYTWLGRFDSEQEAGRVAAEWADQNPPLR